MEQKMTDVTKCFRVVALAALGLLLSACGVTRPMDPWKCALVGAGVGGLGGGIYAGEAHGDASTDHTLVATSAGIAVGALTGYTACALLPKAAPPPPPPAPTPEVQAAPAPVLKKTVVLPGVNFAFNKADLRPGAREILDRDVVPELKANPNLHVIVEGYTDSVGNDEYNMKLSERRAAAVTSYLVEQGIDASRLEAKGFGETNPIASNDTEEGRAKNRRVELKEME